MSPELADAWLAAWEAKAAEDGVERGSVYWQAGWDWIAEQRERPGNGSGGCGPSKAIERMYAAMSDLASAAYRRISGRQ